MLVYLNLNIFKENDIPTEKVCSFEEKFFFILDCILFVLYDSS